MMEYALEAISQNSPETNLIAVTILTSLDNDDLSIMGIDISSKNLVSNLAKLTKEIRFVRCGMFIRRNKNGKGDLWKKF